VEGGWREGGGRVEGEMEGEEEGRKEGEEKESKQSQSSSALKELPSLVCTTPECGFIQNGNSLIGLTLGGSPPKLRRCPKKKLFLWKASNSGKELSFRSARKDLRPPFSEMRDSSIVRIIYSCVLERPTHLCVHAYVWCVCV